MEHSFHPVIIGTDHGSFAIAAAIYDKWGGIHPTVLSNGELRASRYSVVPKVRNMPSDDELRAAGIDESYPEIVRGLLAIGPELQREYPDKKLLVFANTDFNIWTLSQYQDVLSQYYSQNLPSVDLLSKINDKESFPKYASKYGMRTVPTITVDFDDDKVSIAEVLDSFEGPYPAAIKPVVATEYVLLNWDTKKKVYQARDRAHAEEILAELELNTRGYETARRFAVQTWLSGNDTYNLSFTAYVDTHGTVTMISSSQFLVQEHDPTKLGNPIGVYTQPFPGLYRQVEQFLMGVQWRGFANFDAKVDARSGIPYFIEMNPRLGRTMYYNIAAGVDPVEALVADVVEGKRLAQRKLPQEAVFSFIPLSFVKRYLGPRLRMKVTKLQRAGKAANHLMHRRELRTTVAGLRRARIVADEQARWIKSFLTYYSPRHALATDGREDLDASALVAGAETAW